MHQMNNVCVTVSVTTQTQKEVFEMEKKREFIEALGDILREYSRENVNYISYATVNGQEYAQIVYMNGHRKQVNITGDSCAAILHDIYRVLMR